MMGDLHHVTELGPAMSEGVKHLAEITSVQPSSVANGHVEASLREMHKDDVGIEIPAVCEKVQCAIHARRHRARILEHGCGMQGVRVSEASNPSPPQRLILRPVEGREVVQRISPSQCNSSGQWL